MRILWRFLSEVASVLSEVLSDPSARATMIVGIIVYSVLYPQPYVSEILRDVPVVAIDQDNSTLSRQLLREIDATDRIEITESVSNLSDAQAAFFNRDAYGIVLIPPAFEQELLAGHVSPIAAYGDGSYLLIYSNIMTAVGTVARSMGAAVNYDRLTSTGVDDEIAQTLLAPVNVTSIPVFNPQGGYASYVVPAAFVLIIQQTLMMGIGLMHSGRKLPTGMRMWATPFAYVALYSFWIAVTQMALPYIYGIPRTGDVATLAIIALPFLCASTAMGFAIAIAIPWREGVVFFLVVMGMPLFFLSGMSWPIESIPEHLRAIALLVPSTTALPALVSVDQMGATRQDIAQIVQLQIVLATAYTVIAIVMARLTPDR